MSDERKREIVMFLGRYNYKYFCCYFINFVISLSLSLMTFSIKKAVGTGNPAEIKLYDISTVLRVQIKVRSSL